MIVFYIGATKEAIVFTCLCKPLTWSYTTSLSITWRGMDVKAGLFVECEIGWPEGCC